jgi:hypothetical protein
MPERSQAIPSHRNSDSRINVPSWVPRKTHASLAPQAQAKPTRSTSVTGFRSPSKLGLLAPALEARPRCGAKTSTYPHLYSVGLERARPHDKRVTSLPAPISKYVLGIKKSMTWPGSMQRTVLNWHGQGNSATQLCPMTTGHNLLHPSIPILHPCPVAISFPSFYQCYNNNIK